MVDYGPSIPLGPDWTYGGITSPPAGQGSTEAPAPATTSEFVSEASPSAEPSPLPSQVQTTQTPSSPPATSLPTLDPLQTGAGPLGTIPLSASVSQSFPSPSVIGLTSESPTPTLSTAGESTLPPQPTQSSPRSSSNNLVPLLPAILVPLLVAIIILLLLIYCFRRRERSKAGYTTAVGASSGGFGGWLTSSFARRANGSGERFTSAWAQVPETDQVERKDVSPISPVSAENWAKSHERSTLLGFIPNHHRTSSSIDVTRPEEAPAVPEKPEEELEVMADRNRLLLKRLNLGLGWLSVASLVSSGSGSKSRIASGFTLEKGNGGTGAMGVPNEGSESEKTESADKSGSGSGMKGTTSGSASASAAALSNEQLFHRPPHDSTSSRGSTSSRSPRRGFFSRFKTETSSKKSKRSSGPSRKSWMSYDVVPEGEEGEGLREGSEGMSIAVPRTPSSIEGSKRLSGGMTRWDSRERMRFPRPPGTSQGGERESLISTEYVLHCNRADSRYHSAESSYSLPSASDEGRQPTIALVNPAHQPFQSDQSNFARPALSPFGSKESFSPAVIHSQTASTSDKIHLRDLFTASPGRPSIDSDQGNSASGHDNRRSFAGQPMIDDTLLHGGAYKGLGGIDEFGQTMRSVSGEVSLLSRGRS
jgi:hypothetical protein